MCGSVRSQIRHTKRMCGNTNECEGARTIWNRKRYFRYCTSTQELTNVKKRELFERLRSISGIVQPHKNNECQEARNIWKVAKYFRYCTTAQEQRMSRSENYLKGCEVFQVLYNRTRTNEYQGARTIWKVAKYFMYCATTQELTNIKERELFERLRSISGTVQPHKN